MPAFPISTSSFLFRRNGYLCAPKAVRIFQGPQTAYLPVNISQDENRLVKQGRKAGKKRIVQQLNVLIYNNGRLKISKKLWYCGSH
jgi:hypothetical protein